MSITIYHAPQSRAGRVLWGLEELGVPFEKVRVDLAKGEQRTPAFLAINPNGKVPALVIDGTPLFESVAQLAYLGERVGVERGLWPAADDPARGQALMWLVWGDTSLSLNIHRYFEATSPRVPAAWHSAAHAAAARADLEKDLAVLEAHLGGREHLAGAGFSLADVSVAFALRFLAFIDLDLAPWPAVAAYLARATARPAFARAMAAT